MHATLVAPRDRLGPLERRLVLETVARGGEVLLVSGDNRLDAYALLDAARARRMEDAVADGVLVVRAFTVHQLATLLVRDVPYLARTRRPALVLVTGILDMFLDEDVRPDEAATLMKRVLRTLRALDVPVVATHAPPGAGLARALADLLQEGLPARVDVGPAPQPTLEAFAGAA